MRVPPHVRGPREPRGKTPNARKHFGKPPKDCPKCRGKGGVVDTRVQDGYVYRRHVCRKKHIWSSVEIYVASTGKGKRAIEDAMVKLRRRTIDGLIDKLKEMRP